MNEAEDQDKLFSLLEEYRKHKMDYAKNIRFEPHLDTEKLGIKIICLNNVHN